MPMGVLCAPSMFQLIMTETLRGLDVLVYLEDILTIQCESQSTADHLLQVEQVLERLQSAGFKANLRKSFFMQKSVEYLGYQLTDGGIGPQPKKIKAMDRVLPPKSSKQLQRFLGMVNFYYDVFKRRIHMLAPLNTLAVATAKQKKGCKKKPIKFLMQNIHIDAFKEAKDMIKTEVKLAFPDFTKPFHLYTDASNILLGATLVQDGKPLRFYTRKLSNTQINYTVGEKQLLGIVEGLKAFAGVIRGQDLTVHTNHLNLL